MEAKLNEHGARAHVSAPLRETSDARSSAAVATAGATHAALGHVRLLLVGVWLGAALFFSFAVAPSAFAVLPARELAGAIVTRTIGIVNVGGVIIGLLLLATAFAAKRAATRRAWMLEVVALALVVLATGVGHWVVSARMQALRLSMGRPIDELAASDPLRVAFNSLHGYSVAAMTTAMLAALVAFILIARRNKKSGV
ncbi:MAG TPA: DUF4149 domain-containing protein [Pyrinomonadaceae bacterium]|nr:DUF4149 domain-containing protein [Pyrinomonadaceae bacterium]